MIPIISLAFLIFLMPAFAQAEPEFTYTQLGEPFSIRIDETAIIPSDNITVTLLNVTDDSRCPSDVTCVWAGTAHADISIKKNDAVKMTTVELGQGDSIFDYTVSFQKLEPYPKTTNPITQDQYAATFVVTKSETEPIPPLDQFRAGTPFDQIQCKENLVLIKKSSNGDPACVSQKTKEILIERGWAENQ